MSSSRRWLLVFGISIVLLAAVAIVLALTSPSPAVAPRFAADTPEGTVERFLIAVRDGGISTAETYLSPTAMNATGYNLRRIPVRPPVPADSPPWKATVGEAIVRENDASVIVTVDRFQPRGPFESSVSTSRITFLLTREEGSWKITEPLDVWWLY